ncbi:MAG: MotA/TolQ/ExbB proton channel family protein [Planctomycetia bacterium]
MKEISIRLVLASTAIVALCLALAPAVAQDEVEPPAPPTPRALKVGEAPTDKAAAPAAEAKAKAEEDAVAPPAAPAPPKPGRKPIIDLTDPGKIIQQSGILFWPILLCSIVTLTCGLDRWVALRRGRVISPRFVRRFLQRLERFEIDRATALETTREHPSPMAAVLYAAVRHWGRPALEIDQAASIAGEQQVALLRRNLRPMHASANLATLLGLLGTVFGMILAFNDVAAASGGDRAVILAAGVAMALLKTAEGLIVAIPSIFLFQYFSGRVDALVAEMNQAVSKVIDAVSEESLSTRLGAPVGQAAALPNAAAPMGGPLGGLPPSSLPADSAGVRGGAGGGFGPGSIAAMAGVPARSNRPDHRS